VFCYRDILIVSYINNIVIKIVIYKLIAKNNRDAHYISVVSSILSISILLILNYRESCKSENASRDIFIYRYISLIITSCKYILVIETTKII